MLRTEKLKTLHMYSSEGDSVISPWTWRAESGGWGLLSFAAEKTDRNGKMASGLKAAQGHFQTLDGASEQLKSGTREMLKEGQGT